jgi:hypothetical protein
MYIGRTESVLFAKYVPKASDPKAHVIELDVLVQEI